MKTRIYSLLLILMLLPAIKGFSQDTAIVRLIEARYMKYDKQLGENIRRVIGDVIFEHDSAYLYCDSAYLNDARNSVEAFGNVHIESGDTLHLYGDQLDYSGNTKVAKVHGNVKLVDSTTTLTTEHLTYDRKTEVSRYYSGGKIVDPENELTSQIGHYYANDNKFFFKEDVQLVNEDYTMRSDTLIYYSDTQIAHFHGPTTIVSDENTIYCENGWYDTQNDVSQFNENARFINGEHSLQGDSLFYDRNRGFGQAFRNITMIDTSQDVVLKGHYSEYYENKGFSYMTDSTTAIFIEDNDSLFLHADTLKATFDSAQKLDNIYAYYKVKFYRNNLQGACDSMIYGLNDSLISLYRDPVIWAETNQLTADSIKIKTDQKNVDSLYMYNAAFIVSKDLEEKFNQIKGQNMFGYFKNNELKKIFVNGNSETIYYIRQEDNTLVGVQKAVSSNMIIYLRENEVFRINYIEAPDASVYPKNELPAEEEKLRNFQWLESRRPKSKFDIYSWK
ncbi:MAG: hypothetical protein K9I94_09210 [Bacteroidales bacterium]|nr:hypothetical protein [Bacteroidales bacterium]